MASHENEAMEGVHQADNAQLVRNVVHEETSKSEVSPLQLDEGKQQLGNEDLKIIVASCFFFSLAVTIALIVSIYAGPAQVSLHGVVNSEEGRCSEIGTQMQKKGGSTADAVIASMFCLTVLRPQTTGLGGGGVLIIRDMRKRMTRVIDFLAVSPAKYSRQSQGHVLVPGQLAGLCKLHQLYGRLPWDNLLLPSISLARDGFNVSTSLYDDIDHHPPDTPLHRFYEHVAVGQPLKLPAVASLLERLAETGCDGFPEILAADFVQKVREEGGVMTEAEVTSYQAKVTTSVGDSYENVEIETSSLPSGGPVLLAMLRRMHLEDENSTAEGIYYSNVVDSFLMGIQKLGFLWDPKTFKNPEEIVEQILNGTVLTSDAPNFRGTLMSHISASGTDEFLISACSSLNQKFGSGLVTQQGIILNNFGHTFPAQQKNLSSLRAPVPFSPVILYSASKPCTLRMAVGADNYGLQSLLQFISQLLLYNATVMEALNKPRLYLTNMSHIRFEGSVAVNVLDSLIGKKFTVEKIIEDQGGLLVAGRLNTSQVAPIDPRFVRLTAASF